MSERIDATQALIRRLSTEATGARGWRSRAVPLAMVLAALLAFGSVMALLGVRSDLAAALGGIGGHKLLAGAATTLGAGLLYREAARPEGRAWPVLFLLLGLLAFALPILRVDAGMPAWSSSLTDPAGPVCFTTILATALAPLAILMVGLRTNAPGSPALAGLAAGALAAGLAASAYALHCTADTVTVASFWYPAGVVTITLAGALLGPRVLAW